MAQSLFPFGYLDDAQIAGHATGALPAWLWQANGRRILWANAAAADLSGATSPSVLSARELDADDPAVAQIIHLGETLPANGSPRLAALALPGSGQRPMCICSKLSIEGANAILAVATEPARAPLPLDERVRRLIGDSEVPIAVFGPDGNLIHATGAAMQRLGGITTLASLGAGALGHKALADGHAEGETPCGRLRLDRLGRDKSVVLLATLPPAHFALVAPTADQSAAQPHDDAESTLPERAERRHPLRFVWQMDADGRFTVASEPFVALIGENTARLLGQPWIDIARRLRLDPDDQVARAIESRDTWSGITVSWPVEGSDERLLVEMSGLPTFDRDRNFLGYRGFGVCRNPERSAVGAPAPGSAPTLSAGERSAFNELGRALNARLKSGQPDDAAATVTERPFDDLPHAHDGARELMDRLPVGVLVYRVNTPIYANRAFLKWSGDASLEAFIASGGLDRLFLESDVTGAHEGDAKRLTLTTGSGSGLAESRLFSIAWDGERAHALAVVPVASAEPAGDADLRRARRRARELRSIIDIASDGVVLLDGEGTIVRLTHGAEALFGSDSKDVAGKFFTELLAPESRPAARADFEALMHGSEIRLPGREVSGRVQDTGSVPLFMVLGQIGTDKSAYCAAFHDLSRWKRTEQDLLAAKRQAERASQAKSDFLAKISHEIRTPLNAIIGFSEVMMEERLGPVDNDRYRAYLKDIHASGEHLVSLLNDLLDLSKIEAGKLELTFDRVSLNELTQQCVALMQPQANRGRILIRTSLAPGLPPIVADARSVRQIVLNLLSNSIKFTGAGGQVIVSTAVTERNEAVLRVRDTGIGMSEKEIETALEPFRQIETSARGGSGGTGLGLPLTKALAEANRAAFAIRSNVNSGTLVEIAFPAAAER
jgi:PAS domain S-box-containing protein